MAITAEATDPRTDAVYPAAHIVFYVQLMDASRQIGLEARVYADEAAFDAGSEPVFITSQRLVGDYPAWRGLILDTVEPLAIAAYWPDGVRVPD